MPGAVNDTPLAIKIYPSAPHGSHTTSELTWNQTLRNPARQLLHPQAKTRAGSQCPLATTSSPVLLLNSLPNMILVVLCRLCACPRVRTKSR